MMSGGNQARSTVIEIGDKAKPLLIAGPCVIESSGMALEIADAIASLSQTGGYQFVFKASYLKDNRSSRNGYRGPGLDEGLRILEDVKNKVGCPVLSDVHCREEIEPAAQILDVLQIPAFLCRQTRLIEEAAASGKALNIKKGQFLAPEDIRLVAEKAGAAGCNQIIITERGTVFGYHDLVVDFRSFPRIKKLGLPVILDVTHSLQRPSALGDSSGGEPRLALAMARAAAAVPCDGLFVETHFSPEKALSDGASMLPFDELPKLLAEAGKVFELVRMGESEDGSR